MRRQSIFFLIFRHTIKQMLDQGGESMTGFIQISIMVGSREEGQRLVNGLVKNRLIACGQILGSVQSTYWWKGEIETAQEWMCLAKSKEEKFGEIVDQVKQIHSYDVPEIIAVPLIAVDENYARWLEQEVN